MEYLTEEQCRKLNRILESFDNNDVLDGEEVLKIETNERRANGLIDVLQRRGFIKRVDAEEQELPTCMFLNSAATIFLDNGGFIEEYKRELSQKEKSHNTQINVHSTGDSNIINTGKGNTINANFNIYKGDLDALKQELKKNRVEQEDISEIVKIVQSERPVKNSFGVNVNKWIRKMLDKSLEGVWQVGIGAAGGILVEIIKRYYGM